MGSSNNKDVNLALIGEDFTKSSTDSAARNYDKLQNKVNSFSTRKPSAEADQFARLVTSNVKDGEAAFVSIQRTIDDTRTHISGLKKEFATSGSASIFGDLKGAERDLKFLEGIVGDLTQEGEKVGKSLSDGVMSGADSLAVDLPELFTPQGAIGAGILVAVAGVLAPVIAAGLAAAITGGVGLGLLAVAALIQSKNPAVVAAFQSLKADAISVFETATQPLQKPFVDALGYADRLIKAEGPQLKATFTALAPAVAPLIHGLGDLLEDILPGIEKVARSFATVLRDPTLDTAVKLLGGEFASLFDIIGDNPQLVRDFFLAIVLAVDGLVYSLDVLVKAASELDTVFHALVAISGVPQFMDELNALFGGTTAELGPLAASTVKYAQSLGAVGTASAGAGKAVILTQDDLNGLASQMSATTTTADSLAGAMTDKLLNSMLSNDEATLHFHESLTQLSATLKANKDSLNINTAAGQANREAILGAVQANIAQYDALINSGDSAANAAKKYDANTTALQKQLHAAGLTDDQIKGLIGTYGKVPDKVNTDIAIDGLTKAINDLDNLIKTLNGIPLDNTISFNIQPPSASRLAKISNQINRAENGNFAAWTGWMPTVPMASATAVTQAPRDVSLTSQITNVMDGRVIDRHIQRVTTRQDHARRVGVR